MDITACKDFEKTLRKLLIELFGPFSSSAGYHDRTLLGIEKRLGTRIPSVLRASYLIAGRHPAFRKGQQNLIPPSSIWLRTFAVKDTREHIATLAFVQEQQAVTFSVVPTDAMNQFDPPVYQGNNNETVIYKDWSLVSNFLLSAVCWNSIELNVSGSRVGREAIDTKSIQRLRQLLPSVQSGTDGNEPTLAYQHGGIAACVFPSSKAGLFDLYVSARTERELETFETVLGIELSWH